MNGRISKTITSLTPFEAPLPAVERNDARLIGVVDAWMLLRRRQWLIISIVLTSTILAILATSLMPEIYVAKSTVVLERKDSRPFETDIQLKTQDRDKSGTETEMDIMASRLVAGIVVDNLKLLEDPYYNTHYEELISGKMSKEKADVWRDHAISVLLKQIAISRRADSLAIIITVENQLPTLAAKIADSVADTYVNVSSDFKQRFAVKAQQFIKERGSNPLLTTVISEEAQLQQNRAELASKFGSNHPEIQAIDAKIKKIELIIADQFGNMSQDLKDEAERPSARVLSRAQIPTDSSFPRSNLIVLSAFAGSALLAIIAALAVEGLGNTIRSGEQVRLLLQLPNLTYVPIKSRYAQRSVLNQVQEVVMQPQGGFAISMRSLYLACRLPNTAQVRQVVMLTSCLQIQDRSRPAIGLAAAAAADGKKTILVDLDRDDFSVLRGIKRDSYPYSVEDFLSEKCSIADAICESPDIQGLSFIGARKTSGRERIQLNSEGLKQLITALRKSHEFIVINTAPVLVADDANWLAPLVDAAILVLTWRNTKEIDLWDAAYELRLHQVPLIGTVINGVDPRLQARYGLGNAVH